MINSLEICPEACLKETFDNIFSGSDRFPISKDSSVSQLYRLLALLPHNITGLAAVQGHKEFYFYRVTLYLLLIFLVVPYMLSAGAAQDKARNSSLNLGAKPELVQELCIQNNELLIITVFFVVSQRPPQELSL